MKWNEINVIQSKGLQNQIVLTKNALKPIVMMMNPILNSTIKMDFILD